MEGNGLRLRRSDWTTIVVHLEHCLPEEGCGLLAGKGGTVELVIPVENALHSSVRYRMEPRAQIDAIRQIDDLGLEMLAAFHSHPQGPAEASATDRAEWLYPESMLVVCCRVEGEWRARAYAVDGSSLNEVQVAFMPG